MIGKLVRGVVALLALLTLVGCANIPTRGPVEVAPGIQEEPDVGVQVAPEPPRADSSPRTVVEGFLQAMANYQPGYHVARQYLTEDVAESWRPESQVLIYADGYSVATTPDSATLTAPLYGRIGPDGAFSRMDRTLKLDFGLQRNEDGEWRISRPPDGVVMTQYTFDNFYSSVDTYYFDPAFSRLVPDPVYMPRNNRTPTTVLQALLRGASDWLEPSVASAVPPQTRLNVQSASMDEAGVVDVSMTDHVLGLSEERRTRMVTQMLWTLRQLPQVSGLRISVNGEPYPVREQDATGIVPIEAAESLAPDPPVSDDMYGLSEDGVVSVEPGAAGAALVPVEGPLSEQPQASSLAVSGDRSQGAVVSEGETSLVVAPFAGEESESIVDGCTDLLRPDFVGSSTSELWFVCRADGRQRIGMWDGTDLMPIRTDLTQSAEIVNFSIAPDGVRFAAVRQLTSGRKELGIGLIDRSGAIPTVGHWRTVSLAEPGQPAQVQATDVGWVSGTSLAALVTDEAESSSRVIRIDQSGSHYADIGQPEEWDVTHVASSATPDRVRAAVVGRGAWQFEDDLRWTELNPNLHAVAYPG